MVPTISSWTSKIKSGNLIFSAKWLMRDSAEKNVVWLSFLHFCVIPRILGVFLKCWKLFIKHFSSLVGWVQNNSLNSRRGMKAVEKKQFLYPENKFGKCPFMKSISSFIYYYCKVSSSLAIRLQCTTVWNNCVIVLNQSIQTVVGLNTSSQTARNVALNNQQSINEFSNFLNL